MQEWSESQHFIIYFDPTTMAIITKESENNARHQTPRRRTSLGIPGCNQVSASVRPHDIMG